MGVQRHVGMFSLHLRHGTLDWHMDRLYIEV